MAKSPDLQFRGNPGPISEDEPPGVFFGISSPIDCARRFDPAYVSGILALS